MVNDNIIALATPQGEGAIAVIRLSGGGVINVVNQYFSGGDLADATGHTVHFGSIADKEEQIIDEVLVTVFRSPASYTGEDVIEISCHNSLYIIDRLILLFLSHDVRLAEPGEFTLRAYLNGKMDLSQAEAVADLIASESSSAHNLAMNQLKGGVSKEMKKLREQLIHFASMLELELDFSEEDVEFADRSELKNLLSGVLDRLDQLIESFRWGNAIKKGVNTVIAGRPNAGKSTLLNKLLKEDRAIVSDIPGTTRDTIEEVLNIEGVNFRFVDTAGLRDAEDTIEAIGVERTKRKVSESTIILYVFDVTDMTADEISRDIEDLDIGEKNLLLIANKMDLNPYTKPQEFGPDRKIIPVSAINDMNIEYLKEELVTMVRGGQVDGEQLIISNVRHLNALQKAQASLERALSNLQSGLTTDFVAVDIRQATFFLGTIIGEVSTEDLLDNIFSNFCIGK